LQSLPFRRRGYERDAMLQLVVDQACYRELVTAAQGKQVGVAALVLSVLVLCCMLYVAMFSTNNPNKQTNNKQNNKTQTNKQRVIAPRT
jgi:hypothetical protein